MKLKSIHLKDRHPPCSSLWFRFVDKECIDAKPEDDVSPKEVLEALEEKVLCLQLVHEPAVDEEGDVEDDVAEETNDDQRFSSVVLKIKLHSKRSNFCLFTSDKGPAKIVKKMAGQL